VEMCDYPGVVGGEFAVGEGDKGEVVLAAPDAAVEVGMVGVM
jgi:hypothetical protein